MFCLNIIPPVAEPPAPELAPAVPHGEWAKMWEASKWKWEVSLKGGRVASGYMGTAEDAREIGILYGCEMESKLKELHPCDHCDAGTWHGFAGESSQCVYCDGSGVVCY